MTDIFKNVQSLLKIDKVSIDNPVFRLHYKATTILLVTLSLMVTQKQYIGDPIDCITDSVDAKVMDTYCWIHSTYTLPGIRGVVGKHIPHPGIANPKLHGPDELYEAKHHKYYQWVTLVLYLQAIMFYAGRFLWKVWEAGKLRMLLMDLNNPIVGDANTRKSNLVEYFNHNLGKHDVYFWRFFFCEFLNLVNVIGQIFFTDMFFDNEFLTYGSRVVEFHNQELGSRTDPMDEVFPKVTKCSFHRYGSSGTMEKHDALCVLPINILNEKIYIVLWFWFIILAAITGLHFLYRLMMIFSSKARYTLLQSRLQLDDDVLTNINRKCGLGDWLILYQLCKNMDPFMYKEFIEELNTSLTSGSTNLYKNLLPE